jgi:GNAT superfamily N-acetyltransferase
MHDIEIRRARPADAETLTRIAHAAKRHWRYPEEYIELWREALTVTPDFIGRHPVYCAWRDERIVGFYALSGEGLVRELEHMWVIPEAIGKGIGARLLDHAVWTLLVDGAETLRIASDPNAEGFYVKMGARRVGEVPSRPDGRCLPLLVLEAPRPSAGRPPTQA